jgi:hypothetical protein
MHREAQVRFLGGGGAAMRCCYPTQAPCVRLVVASKFYLNFGGSNGITLFGRIYRAGVNQGIFTWRQDGQVGRGRAERQLVKVLRKG